MTPTSLHSPSPSENLSAHPFFDKEFSLPYEEFETLIAQRRIRETASSPSSPASTSPGPAAEGKSSASRRSSVAAAAGLYAGTVSVAGRSSTRRTSGSGSATNASTTTRGGKRKLTKSKLNLAGLVGGDSDSSALTLESGDEGGEGEVEGVDSGVAETPRDSVVTGTATDGDGRTEDGEDEDVEIRDVSSGEISSWIFSTWLISCVAREASPKPTKGRSSKTGGERGRRGRAVGTQGATTRGGTIRGKKKQKR